VLAQAAPPFIGPEVQWYSLAPLITLVGGGLVLMVLSAVLPGRWPRGGYAIFTAVVAGVAATFTILPVARRPGHRGPRAWSVARSASTASRSS
jgi:hypothetical protein